MALPEHFPNFQISLDRSLLFNRLCNIMPYFDLFVNNTMIDTHITGVDALRFCQI